METKVTIKGQVVIPAALRRRLRIEPGTRFLVSEEDGKIILEPLFDNPIREGRGMLPTRGRVLKRLLEDRAEEAKR